MYSRRYDPCILVTTLFAVGLFMAASTARAQITGETDRDLTRRPGNENECAISVNPTNPLQLFALCNNGGGPGLAAARSSDGGKRWTFQDPDGTIADGDRGQGRPACCDPTLAWDRFGNLFIGYMSRGDSAIATILSTDGGATFRDLISFPGSVDQPTITAASTSAPGAPVALWIVWSQDGGMVASGAVVRGLGTVGRFGAPQPIPGTEACSFGDVAIAPNGAVVQACQNPVGGDGGATIYVNTDADGLGPRPFGPAVVATTSNVGAVDYIPAQSMRGIDAEAGLAFDRNPASPHFGRLYLVYTDEAMDESDDTDIMLRFSDTNGATWSAPIRVNDDPATPVRSQFLPRIASNRTGNVVVCWHDARHSPANTGVEVFCAKATPTGASPRFSPNVVISDRPSTSSAVGVEFGDYSGLDYVEVLAHPIWADASNSTGQNPNQTDAFDAFTDRVGEPSADGARTPVQDHSTLPQVQQGSPPWREDSPPPRC